MRQAIIDSWQATRNRLKRAALNTENDKDAIKQWCDEIRVIEYKLRAAGVHIRRTRYPWRSRRRQQMREPS